ncbi:MAG: alpha/beta hydrolase [Hyphomicrobium sp.]|jgi:pimeloyl-ACP methyl ester carboxylesterase
MSAGETQFIMVGDGARQRRIACLSSPAAEPGGAGVLWLIGLKSDMRSTKACALADWTHARGLGFTRFDYSGHGESGGSFEDATLSDWLLEAEEVFTHLTTGPQIIAGSSTGGHVALLLIRRLLRERPAEASRVKGLVLIAPAWDLTEELMWKKFPEEARRAVMETGRWVRPSAYDAGGYAITKRFIEDGRLHLFAEHPAGERFNPGRPIAVLQGAQDKDVPIEHALRLRDVLDGDWLEFTIVADGEHRLSRPEDLDKLYALIERQISAGPGLPG